MENRAETATVFLSGGIGITPSLSMLRYMKDADKDHTSILLWGVGNAKELICSDEFIKMKIEMRNFNVTPIMFKDNTWTGEKGIIDKEKIERLTKAANIDIKSAGYYICGPALMTESVISTLRNMGVNKKFIHFEKFSM